MSLLLVGVLSTLGIALAAEEQPSLLREGQKGFVVASIGYAMAKGATVCPNGRSKGYREIYSLSPEGQRREGESDADFTRRLDLGLQQVAAPKGISLCTHPELGTDPYYRTMTATNVESYGIDLDGQDSRADGRAARGTCPHDDFPGVDGERGIDNQLLRVTGCTGSVQGPGRQGGGLSVDMLQGAWGILITLRGVNDPRNDDSVEVEVTGNADPIKLSPTHVPLPYATYSTEPDPRFRAVAHGRIRDGVLTTEPADMRFHHILNGMYLERPLRDARLRLTFTAEGGLEGYLAGYTPVDEMYDVQYGFRNGKERNGEPAPLWRRVNSARGAGSALGYTCEGAYAALRQLADGHRDPATGRCTSISTQYFLRAIPAFIVN
jgi:hypothetical protein